MDDYIPGINAPTFRELVIQNQNKRSMRLENKFVEKMEESLIKWRPAASSHKGTLMAVNGTHPFQLNTDPERDDIQHNNPDDNIERQVGSTATRSTKYNTADNSIIHNFVSWLYGSSLINEGNQDSPREQSDSNSTEDFEPDGFSFMPSTRDIPYTPSTPVIAPHDENGDEQQPNLDTLRTVVIPNIDPSHREMYESFYDVPIPVTYLGMPAVHPDNAVRHGNNERQEENKGWLSQFGWPCGGSSTTEEIDQTPGIFACFQ